MNARASEQLFWYEFMELYKESPCLWDTNHEFYAVKAKRNRVYKSLLEKYREYDPNGSIHDVKKKISLFRNGYRRELKKVNESRAAGKEVYKPSLWYFDQFTFLDEHFEKRDSQIFQKSMPIQTSDQDDNEESEDDMKLNDSNILMKLLNRNGSSNSKDMKRSMDHDYVPQNKKTRTDAQNPSREELINSALLLLRETEQDDSATFAANLKIQMRKLAPTQKYIAQKLISIVMFLALTNQLNYESSVSVKGESMDDVSHSFTPVHLGSGDDDPLYADDSD